MAPMDIRSRADFDAALKKAPNQLLVIDFHATWCGPCKQIAPLYAQLAERYKASAVFYRCDIDQVPDVWKLQGAEGVPTFSFYAKGARVESFSGADPKRLEDTVKRLSEKYKGFAFGGGSGYSLSGGKATGSAAGSAAAPAAGRGAGGAGGAAAGGPPRRNPWADPNFVPKGSQLHSKGEDAGAAKKADGKAADKPKPKTESPLVALAKERAANPKPAAAPAPAAAKPAEKPAEAKPAAAPAPAAAVVAEPKPAAASASASASAMDVDKPAGAAAADAAPAAAAPAASDAAPAAKPTVNDPSLTKGLNQQTLNELLGMGFTQIRAEKALILTAAKGRAATLEGAIDWLGAHGDDADIDEPLTVVATKPKAGAAAAADFDDSELDDEMKKIVRAARAAPKEGAGGAGGAASDAPVKKSTADMTSEEKQKWLDDRRAAVKAKREAEAREREKESEKNRREVAKAAAKAKEVKETVVAVDSWAVKRKEEADKKAARKRALEKIKQAREEKASRDAMYLAQEKEKAAAAKAAAAGSAKPK